MVFGGLEPDVDKHHVLLAIGIDQPHRAPGTVGIRRNTRVLVCHRVDAEPHGHQLVVQVSGAEVAVVGFLIALLIVFIFIQRYSPPLTGVIAGEIQTWEKP